LKQTRIRFVAAFHLSVGLIGAPPIAQAKSGAASKALARSVNGKFINTLYVYISCNVGYSGEITY
jgi:hypothetical protein